MIDWLKVLEDARASLVDYAKKETLWPQKVDKYVKAKQDILAICNGVLNRVTYSARWISTEHDYNTFISCVASDLKDKIVTTKFVDQFDTEGIEHGGIAYDEELDDDDKEYYIIPLEFLYDVIPRAIFLAEYALNKLFIKE